MRVGLTGRVLLATALVALVVAAVIGILIASVQQLRTDANGAQRSQSILATANLLERTVIDLETGLRGYVITANPAFLQPTNAGLEEFPALSAELEQMSAGNPSQEATARQIDTEGNAYIDQYLQPLLKLVRTDPAKARTVVATQGGKHRVDQLRTLFDRYVTAEQAVATDRAESARKRGHRAIVIGAVGIAIAVALALALAAFLARTVTSPVRRLAAATRRIAAGELGTRVEKGGVAEVGELGQSFNTMAATLEEDDWLKSSLSRLSAALQGHRRIDEAGAAIVSTLAPLAGAERALLFVVEHARRREDPILLRPVAAYGFSGDEPARTFALGEGLPGQAAVEGKPHWLAPPTGYATVASALGEAQPAEIGVIPVVLSGDTIAVLELGSLEPMSPVARRLVEQFAANAGTGLATILAGMRTEELLGESQQQAEELQSQSEELHAQSEELQAQAEELRATNEELAEQAQALQASEELLREQQDELQDANRELQRTADRLGESSRYKSEFLANMSHELRTPLNSLLILAKLLAENRDGNLTDRQVEFAQTMHAAGTDLLELINDILDLSKVEAGRLDVEIEEVDLANLVVWAERFGDPLASERGLAFEIERDPALPRIWTDPQRVQQILANLLGNAFKFTEEGKVILRMTATAPGSVEFSVTDTGIGIDETISGAIFEAFQQGEGGTSRRFGGTGLGLTISRELTELLGGTLSVESRVGEGSTFTLALPVGHEAPAPSQPAAPAVRVASPGERHVLVVEDDEGAAAALVALLAGPDVRVTAVGTATAAAGAIETGPVDCLVLDLGLDGGSGQELLRELRDRGALARLPVVVHTGRKLSRADERELRLYVDSVVVKDAAAPDRLRAEVELLLARGPRPKRGTRVQTSGKNDDDRFLSGRRILVVDDDVRNVFAITSLLEDHGGIVTYAESGDEALERLEVTPAVDLVLMDVMMPGMDGHEATRRLRANPRFRSLPVIALTAKAMPGDRDLAIGAGASDYIPKPVDNDRLLSVLRVWLYDR